jgi:hypothetical protein
VPGLLDPLCVIAGLAWETAPVLPNLNEAALLYPSLARPFGCELSEFSINYMRNTVIKNPVFSAKSPSPRPAFAVPLTSGVLSAAEMRRLVADMVD